MIDRIFCLLLIFSLAFSASLIAQESSADFELKTHKKKEYVVIIHTPEGDMILLLHNETPKHKANFVKLAQEGFFDGTTFHRVMKGFMIQGGDPYSKDGGESGKVGTGGPGYTIEAEVKPEFKHERGSLAAARQPDFANPQRRSSGSQFYIVDNPASCQHLNGAYTIFGQVIEGMEVIDKIAAKPVNRANRPLEDVKMTVEVAFLKKKKITKLYGYKFED